MEDHLTHGNALLNQLCLEDEGPCPSTLTKETQNVMELDGRQ